MPRSKKKGRKVGRGVGGRGPSQDDAVGLRGGAVELAGWSRILPYAIPFVIILLGIIAYSGSFGGAFVLDDRVQILANQRLYSIFPLTETLSGRRPLVDLSIAINLALGRQGLAVSVWGFHFLNLAVHILAGLVLYGIVRRSLVRCGDSSAIGRSAAPLAGIIAGLWVVHPLQTQSVTYIIQRAESMMGLFYLLTLYCVVRGVDGKRPAIWYALAIGACGLGMGCKGIMITAPLVVLLYDATVLSGSLVGALRARWKLYVGLCATWGVLLVCGVVQGTLSSNRAGASVGFSFQGATPLEYAATQPGVLLHYLRLSAWPDPLCLDHVWPFASSFGAVVVPLAVVAIMVGLTVWCLVRRLRIGFLGVWFFLILSPTSSIIPIKDPLFEHRMYLPLAAVVTLVVLAAHTLLRRLTIKLHLGPGLSQAIAIGLAIAAIGAGVAGTISRNRTYQSEITIWQDVLASYPEHSRAMLGLGVSYFHDARFDEAGQAFESLIEIDPESASAYHNLGNVRMKQGKFELAEQEFRRALRLGANNAKIHYSMATLLKKLGRVEEALESYRAALVRDPQHVSAHVNFANALQNLGQYEEAMEHYRKAIEIMPVHANAHYNLGATLNKVGRVDEAIIELERSLKLNPQHGMAERLLNRLRQP